MAEPVSMDVVLVRLMHMEELLTQIHDEVKRTNGRVTALEVENAKFEGASSVRRVQSLIMSSVLSGGILAGIIWFVSHSIN